MIEQFFDYITERQRIWQRKEIEKLPPPWTDDPILQKYHFCNVYRELDYGSIWYRDKVVPTAVDFPDLFFRTSLYRLVNNMQWFQALKWKTPVFGLADWGEQRSEIIQTMYQAGKPHSRAYLILARPDRRSRIERLAESLGDLEWYTTRFSGKLLAAASFQQAWKEIQTVMGIGGFVALQIIRDLLIVKALSLDEDEWCYIGPGAQKGIDLIAGEPKTTSERQELMWKLWEQQVEQLLRRNFPWYKLISLCDIEHNLCEFSKYIKFSQGKGKRRYYRPHAEALPI